MAAITSAELQQYIVPVKELEVGEYTFTIRLSRNFKDRAYLHFYAIMTALLNTSGGVIYIYLSIPLVGSDFDRWRRDLSEKLLKFLVQDVYTSCVSMRVDKGRVSVVVQKAKDFITFDTHMYTRTGTAETCKVKVHRDIVTCRSSATTNLPTFSDKLERCHYMEECKFAESDRLEFKYSNCKSIGALLKRLHDHRTQNTLIALPNVIGGGELIYGIKEEHHRYLIVGQEVEASEEAYVLDEIDRVLRTNEEHIMQRIWGTEGAVPTEHVYWSCKFVPLQPPYVCRPRCRNCPHRNRRVLICIRIHQCLGGVFGRRPESFIISDDGHIQSLSFPEWDKKHRGNTTELVINPSQVSLTYHRRQPAGRNSEPPAAMPELQGTFKEGMTLSYRTHGIHSDLDTERIVWHKQELTSDVFQMQSPVHYIPARNTVEHFLNNTSVLTTIDREMCGRKAFGVADLTLHSCFAGAPRHTPTSGTRKPKNHVMDILVIDELAMMVLYIICSTVRTAAEKTLILSYAMVLSRKLKQKILAVLNVTDDCRTIHIHCKVVCLDGWHFDHPCQLQDRCVCVDPKRTVQLLCSAVAQIFASVPSSIRDEIHQRADVNLSQEQIVILQSIDRSRFTFIDGPPGCGKTLLALKTCTMFGEDNCAYISASLPLNKRIEASSNVAVYQATKGEDIVSALLELPDNKTNIIIDDNHNIEYTLETQHDICRYVRDKLVHLYVFQDTMFQMFQTDEEKGKCITLHEFVVRNSREYGTFDFKTLKYIHRNSQIVASFLKAQLADIVAGPAVHDVECVSRVIGDDVLIKHVPNLRKKGKDNGLLTYVKQITVGSFDSPIHHYAPHDISILIDSKDLEHTQKEVTFFRQVFDAHWKASRVQDAHTFPVNGVLLDHLDNFIGLESKVVIFVVPKVQRFATDEQTPMILREKYRMAVASRAIDRVDFVQEEPLDGVLATTMKCTNIPEGSLHAADTNVLLVARAGSKLLHHIPTRHSNSIDVMPNGDVLCCTRSHGIQSYSLKDGSAKIIQAPPPDLRPCHVAVSKEGNIAATYSSRMGKTHVCLYIYTQSSCDWAPVLDMGCGRDPVVSWSMSGELAVCFRSDSRWVMVLFADDQNRESRRWDVNCDDVTDVVMYNSRVYFCDNNNDSIVVYRGNGKFVKSWNIEVQNRRFRCPASLCVRDNKLLVLHKGRVDGKDMGLVSMWTCDGEYERDVVVELAKPHRNSSVRLHDNTVLVISMDNHIESFDISDIIHCP